MSQTRRVVLAVIVSTFFVGFGGGVVFPILPNLGAVLGISPVLVGLILSANRFTRIVTNGPAGALIDRIGTRRPFVAGLFIEGVATLGYLVALDSGAPAVWFLLARIMWGVGSAFVFATAYTIAADVSDSGSRGTNMGVIRGGMTLGFPSGLVMGGIVSDQYSIPAAFALAAAFALLASVIAYLVVPETHVEETESGIAPWAIDTTPATLTVGFVNAGVFFAYLGALFASLVLYVGDRGIQLFGYGPQGTSGLLMAVTVLSAAAFMLLGGGISDRTGQRVPALLVFLVVFTAGFLLLANADSVQDLVVACVAIGAGQGGTSGPLMALLADFTPNERMGRAMGTNNVLGDVGGGLGPVITLPLIDAFGYSLIYAACAIIPLLAGAGLLVAVFRQTGRLNPSTEDLPAE